MNEYWHWFCNIEEWGAARLNELLKEETDPEKWFQRSGKELAEQFPWVKGRLAERWEESRRAFPKFQREYAEMVQKQIRLIPFGHPEYPRRLRAVDGRPAALYVKGTLPPDRGPAAAIVGARACTEHGRELAKRLAYVLAKAGIGIVSGMATGIDAAAHRGALEAGKGTWAVLGTGVDICYPSGSRNIFEKIPGQGGLLSEFGPGTPARPAHFPMRNRIISGLSDCVIVAEARRKSGALITADCALEQGREVFALPGRPKDVLSEGCNRLIQEGAAMLLEPEDVLRFFSIQFLKKSEIEENKKIGLEKEDEMLYSCLDFEPKHLETILQETGFSAARAMESLMRLELSGRVGQPLKNYYVKKHG